MRKYFCLRVCGLCWRENASVCGKELRARRSREASNPHARHGYRWRIGLHFLITSCNSHLVSWSWCSVTAKDCEAYTYCIFYRQCGDLSFLKHAGHYCPHICFSSFTSLGERRRSTLDVTTTDDLCLPFLFYAANGACYSSHFIKGFPQHLLLRIAKSKSGLVVWRLWWAETCLTIQFTVIGWGLYLVQLLTRNVLLFSCDFRIAAIAWYDVALCCVCVELWPATCCMPAVAWYAKNIVCASR